MIQVQTATFTGAEDFIDITWPTPMTGNYGITDGVESATTVIISFPPANKTANGCRMQPSGRFSGTVNLVAYDRP